MKPCVIKNAKPQVGDVFYRATRSGRFNVYYVIGRRPRARQVQLLYCRTMDGTWQSMPWTPEAAEWHFVGDNHQTCGL